MGESEADDFEGGLEDDEKMTAHGVDEGKEEEMWCGHHVCTVWSRRATCMVCSGEVLREYSEAQGRLWWVVLPAQDGGELHKVVSCEDQHARESADLVWGQVLGYLEEQRSTSGTSV